LILIGGLFVLLKWLLIGGLLRFEFEFVNLNLSDLAYWWLICHHQPQLICDALGRDFSGYSLVVFQWESLLIPMGLKMKPYPGG
jgi:hypothetical protein